MFSQIALPPASSFSVNESSDEAEEEADDDIPYDDSDDDDEFIAEEADPNDLSNFEAEMDDAQAPGQSSVAFSSEVGTASSMQWESSSAIQSPQSGDL